MLDEAHELLQLAQLQLDRLRGFPEASEKQRSEIAGSAVNLLRNARKLPSMSPEHRTRAEEIEKAVRAEAPTSAT